MMSILAMFVLTLGIINRQIASTNEDLNTKRIQLEEMIESLAKNLQYQIQNSIGLDSYKIPEDTYLCDMSGDTISIENIAINSPSYIFYFAEEFCSSCVSQELIILSEIQNKFKNLSFIVLGDYDRARDIGIILKANNIDCMFYTPINSIFFSNLKDIGLPVGFIFNGTTEIKSPFFFQRGYEEYSRIYLEAIIKKYESP